MNLPPHTRVAVVHDWLTGMRGGEKCLEAILELLPGADLFTLVHRPGRVSPIIENRTIRTSFIQRLPWATTRYRHYLPFFPLAVRLLDLSAYDLVVSTSHCAVKAVRTRPEALHLCYCFTPMRYAWDQYDAYFGHLRGVRAYATAAIMKRLRRWDAATASRVDSFLTISRHVARRIETYYGREAEVVYPPVDTGFFTPGAGGPGGYYLVVSALVPYKRLEVVVEAAGRLPYPVWIAGSGPEEQRLRDMAPPGVRFLGWLPDSEIRDLYRGCRALLFPGEEDFGLTPLEAMACGRPVIGYSAGGLLETVVAPGSDRPPSGLLFPRPDADALVGAVADFERDPGRFTTAAARERALEFSAGRFRERMTEAIESHFARYRSLHPPGGAEPSPVLYSTP